MSLRKWFCLAAKIDTTHRIQQLFVVMSRIFRPKSMIVLALTLA